MFSRVNSGWIFTAVVVLPCVFGTCEVQAQFFNRQAVGGVSISTDGLLSSPSEAEIRELRENNRRDLKQAPQELAQPAEMRMISLRALVDAIKGAEGKNYQDLPPELLFLGGIQRLQYIFVYPDQQDIVLAGPGEGWKVDDRGNVVGETTNLPVLHLADLLVALQTTEAARRGGVSCSIDPTPEGRQRLDAYLAQQKAMHEGVPAGVEKALGKQAITLSGVPTTSHFARTMVASDYQMKRLAMNLDESPLKTLPSFLQLLTRSNARITNMMPRWWLACDYEPLGRGDEGLSWEIRGRGVKVMTEDEIVAEDGSVKQTGKSDPIAQKWCDSMNAQYSELSQKLPVFAELRNIMDLAVVAAVISKEQLSAKAGLDLATLVNESSTRLPEELPAPQWIDSRCSLMKRGREWVITASGGVDIDSWSVAGRVVDDENVGILRGRNAPSPESGLAWNSKESS